MGFMDTGPAASLGQLSSLLSVAALHSADVVTGRRVFPANKQTRRAGRRKGLVWTVKRGPCNDEPQSKVERVELN